MQNARHSLVRPLFTALKKALPSALLLGSLSLGLAPDAQAQLSFNFTYNGTSTSLAWSAPTGTFNTTHTTDPSTNLATAGAWLYSSAMFVNTVQNRPGDVYRYAAYSAFPWDTATAPDSTTGHAIYLHTTGFVVVPAGYDIVSGAALAGTMTWNNKPLTDFGFASNDNNASGSFSAYGRTNTWSTSVSAVPEPSACAALFGASALSYAAYRRRRTLRT